MKLTPLAQRVFDGEDPNDNEELSSFIDSISKSDGFWYSVKEGYVDPAAIVAGKDLDKLKKAIQTVREFEEIWNEISWEM